MTQKNKTKPEATFEKMLQIVKAKKDLLIDSIFFEPETIEITPSGKGTFGDIEATTYMPDFIFTFFDRKKKAWIRVVVETKGQVVRAHEKMKMKLADLEYSRYDDTMYVPTYIPDQKISHMKRDFYLYKDKHKVDNKKIVPTFLETIFPNQISKKESNEIFARAYAPKLATKKTHVKKENETK